MDQKDKIERIAKGNKRKLIEAQVDNSQSKKEKKIFFWRENWSWLFFEENNTVYVPGLSRHCAYTQVNEVIILANYSLHPHIHVSLSLQNKIYSSFMRLGVRGARWRLGPYLGIITCLLPTTTTFSSFSSKIFEKIHGNANDSLTSSAVHCATPHAFLELRTLWPLLL